MCREAFCMNDGISAKLNLSQISRRPFFGGFGESWTKLRSDPPAPDSTSFSHLEQEGAEDDDAVDDREEKEHDKKGRAINRDGLGLVDGAEGFVLNSL